VFVFNILLNSVTKRDREIGSVVPVDRQNIARAVFKFLVEIQVVVEIGAPVEYVADIDPYFSFAF
jgi:hypothetical protein